MLKKSFLLTISVALTVFADNTWIETTQADFADGIYERNIYASHLDGGTIEFAPRFDLNNDGYIDIVTCDGGGPYVTIYWGSSSGYDPGNTVKFPSSGAGDCEIADLNNDGYPDFIVTHINSDSRLAIYWGSPTGPSPGNVFNIPISQSIPNEVSYAADLDKDGYLDIVIGTYLDLNTGAIFWGSATGYSPSNRTDLPTVFGAHNTEVADFNNDNWLDIIYVNNNSSYNYIYWGSSNGYSTGNMTSLAAPTSVPHGSSVADLNNDGYLDLVFTSVYGSQSFIYYGSATGYQTYQTLNTGSTYGGSAVCYINDDEYLDIVFFRGWPSALRPIIYWGSTTGYSNSNNTEIGYAINGSGGFVADLNGDNHYDIFVNSRSSVSPIFWGPNYTTSTDLQVNNDHHALFREIGNVYNREYYDDYISSVFDASGITDWGIIEWDVSLPCATSMLFWVRSGDSPTPDALWSDWYSVCNGDSIPDDLNARYLQYKARLAFTNPCYLPSLDEVRVTYTSSGMISASVDIKPEVINLNSHGKFTAFLILPAGYDPHEIDVETVECEGAIALSGHVAAQRFIAKFAVQDLVGVSPGPSVEFMVTGQLFDGTPFSGYDTVRVIGHDVTTAELNCTPNPFRGRTEITFSMGQSAKSMELKIYDTSGRLIRLFPINQLTNLSINQIIWDRKDNMGRKVPPGVYLLKVQGENISIIKKVVVLD